MTATQIHQLIEHQVIHQPRQMALVQSDGKELDYARYQLAIEELSSQCRSNAVVAGDRVLIVAENSLATAACIFACSVVGAIAVPVNARMAPLELSRVIDHADPKLIVFTVAVSNDAQAHAVSFNATSLQTMTGQLAVTVRPDAVAEVQAGDSTDTAVILYTTGTTGDPKGVMLSHSNLLYAGEASALRRDLVAKDILYGALPLTHVFGLASILMAASWTGATVKLESRFRVESLYKALLSDVTVLPAVPQMHALLMQYASENGLTQLQNSKLRYVSSGAAPLDPTWKRKAEAFYGLALQNGYGMTESTAGISNTQNEIGSPDISVGTPLIKVEVSIDTLASSESTDAEQADGDNAQPAQADVGEILTRGPHVMKGYFKNPEATKQVINEDGWLRTGDLGCIDEKGRLHVVGRLKELIIRSGFNVYPPEVETALNDFPGVVQSAVIGRKCENGNEEVLAFVQCSNPSQFDTGALKSFLTEQLAAYKCPSHIVVAEALPAAATGKILKHKLLSTFAQELSA